MTTEPDDQSEWRWIGFYAIFIPMAIVLGVIAAMWTLEH